MSGETCLPLIETCESKEEAAVRLYAALESSTEGNVRVLIGSVLRWLELQKLQCQLEEFASATLEVRPAIIPRELMEELRDIENGMKEPIAWSPHENGEKLMRLNRVLMRLISVLVASGDWTYGKSVEEEG